jgi:hypothetical protein
MGKIVFVVLLLFPFAAESQWKIEPAHASSAGSALTGNFDVDFYASKVEQAQISADSVRTEMPKRYSPMTAGLLSAVVPGAGQFYTQSYWQSITTFSVEVAMWVLYAVYNKKGDRQTNNFQTYADQNWSVVRYVNWIQLELPEFDVSGIIISNNPNLPPWQRVNWTNLNLLESKIGDAATSGKYYGFSHDLPLRPQQQYYELIGKYPQFVGGWDDAWNGSISLYTDDDVMAEKVSANFSSYSVMRGQANTYYAVASTATYVLIANHVLSAMEAAWNAAHKNHEMRMRASILPRVQMDGYVEYVSSFSMSIDF